MFCPSCGTQVPDESSFCMKCGRSMLVPPNVVAPKVENVPHSAIRAARLSKPVVVSVWAVAAIVIVVFVLMARMAPSSGHSLKSPDGASVTGSPAAPQNPVKLSTGEIAAKYSDAVVVLENYNEEGQKAAQGSGFIFSPEGKVLTNYHVIRGASRMVARMHDQSTHEVEYM